MGLESESGRHAEQATRPFREERPGTSSRPSNHADSDERCQTVLYLVAARFASIAMSASRQTPCVSAIHSNTDEIKPRSERAYQGVTDSTRDPRSLNQMDCG